MPFNVQVNVVVDDRLVADALCNAFEGGSTDWCDRVKVLSDWHDAEYAHEILTYSDGRVKVYFDGESKVVEHADLQRALETLAAEWSSEWNHLLSGDADADTGDLLFQLTVFGEVVYG